MILNHALSSMKILTSALALVVVSSVAWAQQVQEAPTPATEAPPAESKPVTPPKKTVKVLNVELGVGYPGGSVEAPSKHLDVSLDLFTNGRIRWGPYLGMVMADSKETLNFPSTGYTEVRHSKVTSYLGGLQGRWKWKPRFDIKAAVGFSYTSQEVTSVDTTAPVPSSAVGYTKNYPLSLDAKLGLQYTISKRNWAYGAELGYEATSLTNSAQSISAIYLNALLRYGF